MNTASVIQEGIEDLKETMENVQESLNEAACKLTKNLTKFGKKTCHAGELKLMEVQKDVEGYMRRYPFRILGAAIGAGLLIGWAGSRK